MGADTKTVDVLAVLKRHVALAEQVGCREQQAEAHALFDAVEQLISALRQSDEWIRQARREVPYSADATLQRNAAALRAVGGV